MCSLRPVERWFRRDGGPPIQIVLPPESAQVCIKHCGTNGAVACRAVSILGFHRCLVMSAVLLSIPSSRRAALRTFVVNRVATPRTAVLLQRTRNEGQLFEHDSVGWLQ